jgi:ATPase
MMMNSSILDQYFQTDTMSVHFKTQTAILTKSGRPGAWRSERRDLIMSREEIQTLIETIYEEIPMRTDAFLEIDKPLSKVIQL